MGRGPHKDMRARLDHDFEQGFCTTPQSTSDERRLKRARQAGRLISPAPHLFVQPDPWNELRPNVQHRYVVRSLARLHPNWIFSHVSAAVMHGLYVSYTLINQVHILTDRHQNSASNAFVRRHKVTAADFTIVDDVRATTLARTAFDCLRSYDFRAGLAVADSASHQLSLSGDELGYSFTTFSTRNLGWRRACKIAGFADGRSENGGESVARAVMIERGYRIPNLQVVVNDSVDGNAYRVDFCWQIDDRTRVLGELDGREKYRNPHMTQGRDVNDVLADERLRESRVSVQGDRIMRFSYADVIDTRRFCKILDAYHVPKGYAVPDVASPDDPINRAAIQRRAYGRSGQGPW